MEVDEGAVSSEEGQLEEGEVEPSTTDPPLKLRQNQVTCQFFGSFYNDTSNEEPSLELLEYSHPVRLTEIRVIPLGASVTLSNGVPQLGSTNPARFDLEFYYEDATDPRCTTFKALGIFGYEEKSSIQLLCGDDEAPIYTTRLVVKGFYNSLTLATYGYVAEDVPIKPAPPAEVIKIKSERLSDHHFQESDLEKSENDPRAEDDSLIKVRSSDGIRGDGSPLTEVDEDAEMKDTFDVKVEDSPRAIPTISTRVNFIPTRSGSSEGSILPGDAFEKVESLSSGEDPFDELTPNERSRSRSTGPITITLETEDISDGDISSEGEEILSEPKASSLNSERGAKRSRRESSIFKERGTLSRKSPSENLGDRDSEEEFAVPAVEEILSEEEMPDYADIEFEPLADLTEYDEALLAQFGKSFSTETFPIPSMRNLSTKHYGLGLKGLTDDKALKSKFLDSVSKFSRTSFEASMLECWVELLEQLLPVFNTLLYSVLRDETPEVLDMLLFWVRKGVELYPATTQPALTLNLRHIKAGVKLIHCVCNYSDFLAEEVVKLELDECRTTIQLRLLQLLMQEQNNTPVLQHLILKALDATLNTRLGYLAFTTEKPGELSIYQQLIQHVVEKQSSKRFGFSLRSFLKKVNVIHFLHDLEQGCSNVNLDDVLDQLNFIGEIMEHVEYSLGYHLKFLPAQVVVEIPQQSYDPKLNFVKILKEGHFMETCANLLRINNAEGCLTDAICRILSCLLTWEAGLIYLCQDKCTPYMWKLLSERSTAEFSEYFAHCLEVVKCADALASDSTTWSNDEIDEAILSLHNVYNALSSTMGRKAIAKTFCINNVILPILQCIKESYMDGSYSERLSSLERVTMNGYAVDLLCFIVKTSDSFEFLCRHGADMFKLIVSLHKGHENSDKLQNLLPFLKPTLDSSHFTVEGIELVLEILKSKIDLFLQVPRRADCNWGFTPEIVTTLRILNGLAIPQNDFDEIDDITVALSKKPEPPMIRELKYKIGYVRMNSVDLISTLTLILTKINTEFEQPTLHTYTWARAKGDALVSVVLPIIRILRKLLTEVIQVRNTSFRDITLVPILLETYNIFHAFPSTGVSLESAQKIKQHIIGALLAFTTPVMKLGEESEEELTKSIWTLMVSEVINFTLTTPRNFIPGLVILSELLPLPLPVYCDQNVEEEEELRLISLRRLWSAFLHGVSSPLQDLIGILCESSDRGLLVLLRRVCLQLADLSPSTCLVVCRAIMDPIVMSIESDFEEKTKGSPDPSSSVTAWVELANDRRNVQCSARTSRLLGFLASLVRKHGVIKTGVMHTFRVTTKADEKFADFMTMLSCILTSCSELKPSSSHVTSQGHVMTIFHSLCNIKVNMLVLPDCSLSTGMDVEYLKANALPQKDNLNLICASLLTFLDQQENILGNVTSIRKIFFALSILCNTEYEFFHLRGALGKNSSALHNFILKLRPLELESLDIVGVMESLEVVDGILRILMTLIIPQQNRQDSVESRQSVLSVAELRKYLSWSPETTESSAEEGTFPTHPLLQLDLYLRKCIRSDSEHEDSQGGEEQQYLNTYMTEALDKLDVIIAFLKRRDGTETPVAEVPLMAPDSLADLYSHRIIIVRSIQNPRGKCDVSPFTVVDNETESERSADDMILCDLLELSKSFINEADIMKELDIAWNLYEGQAESAPRDTSITYREVHARPKAYDLYSNMRGGTGSGFGLSSRKSAYNSSMRGSAGRSGGFNRGMSQPNSGRSGSHFDPFRSRPPNTSRPPSLHVDDFVALETSGQGSSSSGYNKSGRSSEPFRGRGSRSSPGNRSYNSDRGRAFRSPGSQFFPQRNDSSSRARGRGGNNRGYGSGNERWQGGNETRASPGGGGNFGMRQQDLRNYDRGTGQGRGSGRQSFGRGHVYRDGLGSATRTPGSGGTSSNSNSSSRWRDKSRQFNR